MRQVIRHQKDKKKYFTVYDFWYWHGILQYNPMEADYGWFLEDFFYYLAVIYCYIVMYINVNVNTMRYNLLSFIFIEVTNSVGTQLERRCSKLPLFLQCSLAACTASSVQDGSLPRNIRLESMAFIRETFNTFNIYIIFSMEIHNYYFFILFVCIN